MKRTHDNYSIDLTRNKHINQRLCQAKNVRELIDIYNYNKHDYNHVNLITTVHRFAKLINGEEINFIYELIPLIRDKIYSFNAQDIANLAWAFATLNVKNIELFDRLAEETRYKINSFNIQNIANLAWAFAKLDIKNIELFDQLAQEIQDKIKSFSAQNIANLAWAFATLNINNIELFNRLAQETQDKIKSFNAQGIANLAWAFATLGIKNVELFDQLAQETQDKIKSFNAQGIANLAWAFATLDIKNIELFDQLSQEAQYKITSFSGQNIANLAYAFATLGIKNIILFDRLAEEAQYKINSFNSQNIVNLMWAFAVLNIKNIELFKLLINNINHPNVIQLQQIYYIYLYCKYELKSDQLIGLMSKFDFTKIIINPINSSPLHLDCVLHFELLGINYQNEININGLYCDIYLPDKNLIIEVNGPSHYTYNDIEPLGPTILKERLLRAMGYKVKIIPWWEWDDLDNEEEKKEYILKLLQ